MLEELKQALDRQKTDGAEESLAEVIARAFEVEPDLVHRILFAQECLVRAGQEWRFVEPRCWEVTLPNAELRQAIRHAMTDGLCRLILGQAIRDDKKIVLPVKLLIPEAEKDRICEGCPERLQCSTTENFSTPENCWSYARRAVHVRPLRIIKDDVEIEASQPAGKYLVPIRLIDFTELPNIRRTWER